MHRAYQPIMPTANLYLQDKWDRNKYEMHRKKVAMAVPAVDTKGSETPTHLLVNVKKMQMNREVQALTEKQNLIHSNKLNAIRQSQGRIDNWNFYPQRSLNAAQQRQNVSKISYENGKILERILRRESEYGRWETEWEKVKRIQANISRYPQVTWAGQHRVTFMDYKRNADIHNLFEGSETDSTQSRSTLKLESIPKRADRHRKKELSELIDIGKGLTPMQTEKLVESEGKGEGSPYRFCKKGTVISVTPEKANYTDQAKHASNQKSFSKSKNCAKCFAQVTSGEREQDDVTEGKDISQEECKSEKSQPGEEGGTKLKNARKTPMSTKNSAQTFDSIQEESAASSCYSFDDSKESSSCSSPSSEISSASSTSLRSVETPVRSSHKLRISNTQNLYRGHEPSSLESSISPTSIRHPDTPLTSFNRADVSNRQSLYSSQELSPPETMKSHYAVQQLGNGSTDLSERTTNSSPESLVIYPQKWPI